VPLTRFENDEELAQLEARAKARLIEKIQRLEVKDFLSESDKEKMSATP
jgi:hypothetical protein